MEDRTSSHPGRASWTLDRVTCRIVWRTLVSRFQRSLQHPSVQGVAMPVSIDRPRPGPGSPVDGGAGALPSTGGARDEQLSSVPISREVRRNATDVGNYRPSPRTAWCWHGGLGQTGKTGPRQAITRCRAGQVEAGARSRSATPASRASVRSMYCQEDNRNGRSALGATAVG